MPPPPALATFPLHPIVFVDGKVPGICACPAGAACPTAGKHPAYAYSDLQAGEVLAGPPAASDGPAPGPGYGIATGERSGVFVVDLDVRPDEGKDGIAAFAALGECPPTLTVATPTGGRHLYFRNPPGLRVKTTGNVLAPGVDVRGEGGFVVGPGSPHRKGGTYAVVDEDVPVADAPTWLLDLLGEAHVRPVVVAASRALPPEEEARRVALARTYLAAAAPCIDGKRGGTLLFKICMYLVVRLELPHTMALALLEEDYNARCLPPWSRAELEHKLIDAAHSERAADPAERGPAPEWAERWIARWKATPVFEAGGLEGASPNAARRVHVEGHRYTYTPGDRREANEPTAIKFTDLQADLYAHAEWDGVLQWDDFRARVLAVDPPVAMDAQDPALGVSDRDVEAVRSWFEAHGHLATSENVRKAIELVAYRRKFHPIKEYLEGLPEADDDAHAALASFAALALGNADPIAAQMVEKTLVAAVRRVLTPGNQVDSVLVLTGAQAARKSTLLRVLFGEDFFKDQLPEFSNKDASAELRTAWCVELAELVNVRKMDREAVKAFLSRRVDTYHARYSRSETRSPRHCIFIGTTNAPEFLNDPTGDRRYWPVVVRKEIDLAWVREHRDELWSAAYALALDPTYEHFFDDYRGTLNAYRADFQDTDGWLRAILEYATGRKFVRRDEVYMEAVACGDAGALAKAGKAQMDRVVDVLQALGCTPGRGPRDEQGKRDRRWLVPDTIANAEPSAAELKRRATFATAAKLGAMAK